MKLPVRLTKQDRELVADEILRHRFGESVGASVLAFRDFAVRVYEDFFSESVRGQIYALPEGWLQEQSYFTVVFGGSYTHMEFDGYGAERSEFKTLVPHTLRTTIQRRFPNLFIGLPLRTYEADAPLSLEYGRLKNARIDLIFSVRDAKTAIRAALNSAPTVRSLLKDWPEVEPFVRKVAGKESTPVPAIPAKKLNDMLKLPLTETSK